MSSGATTAYQLTPVSSAISSPYSLTPAITEDWELLQRIASVFKIKITPLVENYQQVMGRCFDAALEACRQQNWSLITGIQNDVCRITDAHGKTLLTRAMAENNGMLVSRLLDYASIVEQSRPISSISSTVAATPTSDFASPQALKEYERLPSFDSSHERADGPSPIYLFTPVSTSPVSGDPIYLFTPDSVKAGKLLEVSGENDSETAKKYHDLGTIFQASRDEKSALEYHLKALSLRKNIFGKYHPDTAASCLNVGKNLSLQGEHQRALEYCETALEISTKVGEGNSLTLATYHIQVGNCLWALKPDIKAVKSYENALKIYQKKWGDDHPVVLTSMSNIGWCYGELGKFEKALKYEEKVLTVRRMSLGEDHIDTGKSYNSVGISLAVLGDKKAKIWSKKQQARAYHEKGLTYKLEALRIRRKCHGEEHISIAESMNNLGVSYAGLERYDEAASAFFQALKMCLEVIGENHQQTVRSYNNVGAMYNKRRDYSNALEHLIQGFTIAYKSFPKNPQLLTYCFRNLVRTLKNHPKSAVLVEKKQELLLLVRESAYFSIEFSKIK
ncbi:MAG: Photosystem I assembly protein Ycf3 [Chlamydiae bacterium]|nr:Photosystem I assembly protein Ycf3 [Chlamydiota bacterium]